MPKQKEEPNLPNGARSVEIAKIGIQTSSDFIHLFSALISDLLEGKVQPETGAVVCNAGKSMLKMIELTMRKEENKAIQLIPSNETGFPCSDCSAQFASVRALGVHRTIVHFGERSLIKSGLAGLNGS